MPAVTVPLSPAYPHHNFNNQRLITSPTPDSRDMYEEGEEQD